jgi:predicted nucleic acid-binding Zn finger protein
MRNSREIKCLKAACEEAELRGTLTEEHRDSLEKMFGSRFLNAWRAVDERRVKKYIFKPSGRVLWIVVGRGRDYLIMPAANFCSCDDFYFNVIDHKIRLCYHLIAQRLAESLKAYDTIEEEDSFYDILMREWRKVTP